MQSFTIPPESSVTRPSLRRLLAYLAVATAVISCQTAEQQPSEEENVAATGVAGIVTPSPFRIAPPPRSAHEAELQGEAGQDEPVPAADLWQRIRSGFRLQRYYFHPQVLEQIHNYDHNQTYFDLVSERARPFLFAIVEEIEQRDLPLELALLPIVESTFDANAYSAEHAVGLWQFVGATADSFGLQRDWWYDGRRDPVASTRAALAYLQLLYEQFDQDWLLALAAYNTGDGNVRRAIRRSDSGQSSYWDLALPRETQFHVPRLLALAAVISDQQQFGLVLPLLPNEAVTATAQLDVQLDLATAARLIDMEPAQLHSLNPGYLQWATHPDAPQSLLVPKESAAALVNLAQTLPAEQRVSWDSYVIEAGDTLSGIARKLNSRVDILKTVNSISGSRIIAGDILLVPRVDSASQLSQLVLPGRVAVQVEAIPAQYRVRRGDNLWSIARRFDLHSADIARHNNIELQGLLRPGQTLDLSFALGGIAE
ncbi:MAG: transglycosylase SLT domain-containing protein [Gammaproteobacteria bacterium]